MGIIGEERAKSLLEAMLAYSPFGVLVVRPPEKIVKAMEADIARAVEPSSDPKGYSVELSDEEHGLYPLLERTCTNTLVLRAVVSREGFMNFIPKPIKPKKKEIKNPEDKYGKPSWKYSSETVMQEFRLDPTVSKIIGESGADYFLVGKFRNEWYCHNLTYTADIPLIAIPGENIPHAPLRSFALTIMRLKSSIIKKLGHRGITYHDYTTQTEDNALEVSFGDYLVKTEDHNLIRLLGSEQDPQSLRSKH